MRSCTHLVCAKDQDTGETFCAMLHKWVDECPKKNQEEDDPND